MRIFRQQIKTLLGLEDSPERTALAFALGVFVGYSPFLGLHTILGLTLAFVLRMNRLAVIVGVYSNTPWWIVPYYALATWLGFEVLGFVDGAALPTMAFRDLFEPEFWMSLQGQWRLLIPPFVGSLILSSLLSLLSYPLALFLLRRYRRYRGRRRIAPELRHGERGVQ